MHTYILTREHANYGEVSLFVVVAESPQAARALAMKAREQEDSLVWDIAVCEKIETHEAHVALRQVMGQ